MTCKIKKLVFNSIIISITRKKKDIDLIIFFNYKMEFEKVLHAIMRLAFPLVIVPSALVAVHQYTPESCS